MSKKKINSNTGNGMEIMQTSAVHLSIRCFCCQGFNCIYFVFVPRQLTKLSLGYWCVDVCVCVCGYLKRHGKIDDAVIVLFNTKLETQFEKLGKERAKNKNN